jgi:hypothetical protein
MTESADQYPSVNLAKDQTPEVNALSWPAWQRSVLRVLRMELRDLVHHLGLKDVDWPS